MAKAYLERTVNGRTYRMRLEDFVVKAEEINSNVTKDELLQDFDYLCRQLEEKTGFKWLYEYHECVDWLELQTERHCFGIRNAKQKVHENFQLFLDHMSIMYRELQYVED